MNDRARAAEAQPWATAITDVADTRVYFRGHPVDGLLGERSFGDVLHLLWAGVLPEEGEGDILEACLVAAADHGPLAPSALSARTAASTRQRPIACIASGLLAMTDYHAAGVSGCMEILAGAPQQESQLPPWAVDVVAEARAKGRRVPGVGHRRHPHDVRSERLLDLLEDRTGETRLPAAVRALAGAVSARAGRPMPVNIDGAIAACLVQMGFDPHYGDLLFAISRSAGLSAHVMEERHRERPMRTIDPTTVTYDGSRPLDGDAQSRREA